MSALVGHRGEHAGSPLGGEAEPSFFKADVALPADDEVVQHFDVEQLACFHNLLSDLDVLGTGCRVSRRVIVHHHPRPVVLHAGADNDCYRF